MWRIIADEFGLSYYFTDFVSVWLNKFIGIGQFCVRKFFSDIYVCIWAQVTFRSLALL